MKRFSKLLLSCMLLGSVAIVPTGCGGGGGGGSLTPPAAPEYENPYDELKDMPAQIDAQIKWVTEPVDEAHAVGNEFKNLAAELDLSADQITALGTASFKDGKFEVSADLNIEGEAKAKLEAQLEKISKVAADLKTIPKRATKVTMGLGKYPLKVPGMAKKATAHLKAELEAAAGEAKAEIEGKLSGVVDLQAEIIAKAKGSIDTVKGLPASSAEDIKQLGLAFAGQAEFKASASAEVGAEAEAEGDLDAEADAEAEAGAEADAEADAEGGDEEASE